MRPFPTQSVTRILESANKLILIEDNFVGQLGELIREKTGIKIDLKILKYDGRAISQNEVEDAIKATIEQESARLVVSHS